MLLIHPSQFHLYQQNDAIFICGDTVLLYPPTHLPFLPFDSVMASLDPNTAQVFLYQNLLLIWCKTLPDTLDLPKQHAKSALASLNRDQMHLILVALQWLNWQAKQRYCHYCAQPLTLTPHQMYKVCSGCRHIIYPNLPTAVLILVYRQHQILLVQRHHTDYYSAISGFVDVAETAEQATHRETYEETGLIIGQPHYYASQSWPFPQAFMLAFSAEYQSGELIIQSDELADARWFDIDQLPNLPSTASLARALIDRTISHLLLR